MSGSTPVSNWGAGGAAYGRPGQIEGEQQVVVPEEAPGGPLVEGQGEVLHQILDPAEGGEGGDDPL